MIITIKQLLDEKDISIDISDDYDESLFIAYESGFKLTKDGEDYFKDILDLEVKVNLNSKIFEVLVAKFYQDWVPTDYDNENHINKDGEVAHPLHWKVYELFEGLAGYVNTDDYDRWFEERKGE
jgi:hypothetical protein